MRKKKLFLILLYLCLTVNRVYSQDKEAFQKSIFNYDFPGLKNKVSLDIRDMDIGHFLKFIALEGKLNIVASKEVSGTVNLLINDVIVGDALEIGLSISNLAYEVKGSIIKVMTNDEYKNLYGVDFYDQRKIIITQMKYASAVNVGTLLGNVKSEIGKVIYDESTGTVVLIDTPEKIEEMKGVIKEEELPTVTRVLPTETKVYELKYATVGDIKDELTKVLTADIGSMQTDERTKTMVITDLPHQHEKIECVINAFDRKVREVFIEAKIVEVTLTDTFKWGIDWEKLSQYTVNSNSASKFSIKSETSLPLTLTDNFGKITIASIGNSHLSAVLEFLQTITDTRILSNPHLTVAEGKEASIKVIERQPYQEETTTTASGGSSTTSKSYQWVDVGVSLAVTPSINKDGYISILIKPEVSSISTWYGGAAQSAGAVPVVKSANAETAVTIKDGVTVIIAGLIKDQKTKTVNKIPFLAEIPFLGKLFRSVSDDVRRTETVVFLTPRIVTGAEPFLQERYEKKKIKGIRD